MNRVPLIPVLWVHPLHDLGLLICRGMPGVYTTASVVFAVVLVLVAVHFP